MGIKRFHQLWELRKGLYDTIKTTTSQHPDKTNNTTLPANIVTSQRSKHLATHRTRVTIHSSSNAPNSAKLPCVTSRVPAVKCSCTCALVENLLQLSCPRLFTAYLTNLFARCTFVVTYLPHSLLGSIGFDSLSVACSTCNR